MFYRRDSGKVIYKVKEKGGIVYLVYFWGDKKEAECAFSERELLDVKNKKGEGCYKIVEKYELALIL